MDNEFDYILSSHSEEPEPVPFRDKHPNLFWLGVAAATGGGLGLMRWLASFLIGVAAATGGGLGLMRWLASFLIGGGE